MGKGVKKIEKSADVVYGHPLRIPNVKTNCLKSGASFGHGQEHLVGADVVDGKLGQPSQLIKTVQLKIAIMSQSVTMCRNVSSHIGLFRNNTGCRATLLVK